MRRRAASLIASGLVLLAAAACGSGDDNSGGGGGADDPILIGAVAPLTGAASSPGTQHVNGLKAAVQYVNDNGGIMGRKVELLVEDSGGNPVQSVAKFKLLASKKISVTFGDLLAGYTALVPEFTRTKIISISQNTTDSIWDKASTNPYGFNVFVPTRGYAQIYVDYLVKHYNVKKIGVLGSTDTFSTSMFDAVKSYAPSKGVEVVTQQFDPNATNVTTQMRALKDAGADGLISATFASGQVLSIKAQQELNWDPPAVTSNTLNTAAGVQAVQAAGLKNLFGGPVAKIMMVDKQGAPENDKAKILLDSLQKVTGKSDFDGTWTNSLTWFDGLLVYKAAAEKAGSTDPAKVKEALESNTPFAGLSGDFRFTTDSHVTQDETALYGLYTGGLSCPRTCVAAPGEATK